ncbi:hypothetical protein Tco_0961777, partial [Tanacetum coccineum]
EELSEYIIYPSWNHPTFYDNDDDEYTIIYRKPTEITPDLLIEEPDNTLSMGDEHLDNIPSVENLVPIPSELEGISDETCDVPVCEDPSTFDALSDHSEILSDSNNDGTSSDDDSYENIEYIEASPLNLEIVSLEEVNKYQEEKEFDLEDIFQIQDKSNTSFSYSDNSLPEFETFSDHTEETRSGSTTTHANNSLPEFKSFHFDLYDDPSFPRPPPEPSDVENCLNFEPDTVVINNFDEDEYFDPGGGEIVLSGNVEDDDSFTFVIQTFLPFLTYPEVSPLLSSASPLRAGGISSGWNFYVYPNINESPIEIFFSIHFLQGRMNSEIESSYVTQLPKTKRFVGGTPCLSIFYFLSSF